MSGRAFVAIAVVSVMLPALPGATAQVAEQTLLSFQYSVETPLLDVGQSAASQVDPDALFTIRVRDTSVDPASGPAGPGQQGPRNHVFEAKASWPGLTPAGWSYEEPQPRIFTLASGQEADVTFKMKHSPSFGQTIAKAVVNITIYEGQYVGGFSVSQQIDLGARIIGEPSVFVQARPTEDSFQVKPGTIVTVPFLVQNTDFYVNTMNFQVTAQGGPGVDPRKLGVAGGGTFRMQPLEQRIVNISFVAPNERIFYSSLAVTLNANASVVGSPGSLQQTSFIVIVHGFNWQPPALVLLLPVLAVIFVLVVFFLAARRGYETVTLGKPIPPWKIPEEEEELERLRQEDPKNFYVVRYFMMPEEYRSSLLWYDFYKSASQRTRKHEAASDRLSEKAEALREPPNDNFEARAERLRNRYKGRMGRRRSRLDRRIERLERRLDRHYEKDFGKEHTKWEEKVEKLRRKANKPVLKERDKLERKNEKVLLRWEDEVEKIKARHRKELESAREAFEKDVRKKDKEAWKAWRSSRDGADAENQVRTAEGRELVPVPELTSREVPEPEWPKEPELPSKPRGPKLPELVEPEAIPTEPALKKPTLKDSRYGRKARRSRKKADRKVARLERKLERKLRKNTKKGEKAARKQEKKRHRLERRSAEARNASLFERAFRLTPEHHERRAHQAIEKARAKDRIEHLKDSEDSRLERMGADHRRKEAELERNLLAERIRTERMGDEAPKDAQKNIDRREGELAEVKDKNRARLEKAKEESRRRIANEEERLAKEAAEPSDGEKKRKSG